MKSRWNINYHLFLFIGLLVFSVVLGACEKFEDCEKTYSPSEILSMDLSQGAEFCVQGSLTEYVPPEDWPEDMDYNLSEIYYVEDDVELGFIDEANGDTSNQISLFIDPEYYNAGIFNSPNKNQFQLPSIVSSGTPNNFRIKVIAYPNDEDEVVLYMVHLTKLSNL